MLESARNDAAGHIPVTMRDWECCDLLHETGYLTTTQRAESKRPAYLITDDGRRALRDNGR